MTIILNYNFNLKLKNFRYKNKHYAFIKIYQKTIMRLFLFRNLPLEVMLKANIILRNLSLNLFLQIELTKIF